MTTDRDSAHHPGLPRPPRPPLGGDVPGDRSAGAREAQEQAFLKLVEGLTVDGGPAAPAVGHQRLLDLVVSHWRQSGAPGPLAPPLAAELALLPSRRKCDGAPVVLLQFGALQGVLTVPECHAYAAQFVRAAEDAVTHAALHEIVLANLGPDKGEALFRDIHDGLVRFRQRHR